MIKHKKKNNINKFNDLKLKIESNNKNKPEDLYKLSFMYNKFMYKYL